MKTNLSVKHRLMLLLLICVLSAFSYIIVKSAIKNEYIRLETGYFVDAQNIFFGLEQEIDDNLDCLASLNAFYHAIDTVEKSEFYEFSSSLIKNNHTIQALEWAPFISNKNKQGFEQKGELYYPGFRVTERDSNGEMVVAGNRPAYYPVLFLTPLEGNESAVGYDLGSDKLRNAAIQKAISRKEPAITERISLVQEEEKGQYGFLVLSPVFMEDTLKGFTLGVFRAKDIVEKALEKFENNYIDISLFDITESTPPQYLYHTSEEAPAYSLLNREEVSMEREIKIAGRSWVCVLTPKKPLSIAGPVIPAVIATCLLCSGFILFYITYLMHSLNEKRKKEMELRVAYEKERQLSLLKTRFLSIASHEFRTPLSAVLSSAGLIQRYIEKGDMDRVPKHVDRIRKSVGNLSTILNDFITDSKLEEGVVNHTAETFKLKPFLKEILNEVETIKKPGQGFVFNYDTDVEQVFLDKQFLHNIMINLLSNAIKYSPEDKPITISTSSDNHFISIHVKDEGIGIPDKEQKFLFTRFFRAHNAANIKGTGLGLSIVKKYVELMKGKIRVASKVGEGSVFMLDFPL